ncbi:BIR protein [Plasmodium berghei]|uniref:BIR protein n=2 Tax=Plasmodium berghei TaxID=5821 RepID=A0A509AIY9_PLABA|nr:BIR protein [Plasmodium berghei ANKA]SBW38179.1 BIR protein [Plasmodium berghei]SCL82726.1 BIR protein [Plasmodium berghei]SCL83021.1 BIR protein [Plasmodium berghei]VUC55985.1 BIR protein [Plasmodium berghei ANKA]|eukprot:XP_034421793.1 BIR protein [Plasmodium berghei ANKA]
MDNDICSNFDILRDYIPDELGGTPKSELKNISNYKNYCPNDNCDTELEKITIGFLWLLEQCFSTFINKNHNENNTNAYFIYIILWLSYQLNQRTYYKSTPINDFYNEHVKNSDKYKSILTDSYRIGNLKEFMDEQYYLLDINIEDLSKFYGAFKVLCEMYTGFEANMSNCTQCSDKANQFVEKCKDLIKNSDITSNSSYNELLSTLSTDYDNFKIYCNNKGVNCENFPTLPTYSRRSVIKKIIISIAFIFVAVAIFFGIAYKYSLFGFRKRALKQYLREKIKNIKKRMNY